MGSSPLRTTLLRWLTRAERRWIPNETFGDLVVQYACSAVTRSKLSQHTKLAVTLLGYKAPAWYRRVQAEVASATFIELGPGVGLARFTPATRDCVINATRLLNNTPEWAFLEIAFVLVHEATHAWLERHGVYGSSPAKRLRIERICNRAEACLAARVPELPFLADIVARRRGAIPVDYTAPAVARRRRAYYWALVRGMVGG